MKAKWRLSNVDETHQIVTMWSPNASWPYRRLVLYRSANGIVSFWGGRPTTVPQNVLEDLHAQAVGYVGLLGTVEGFPEVELELGGSN